MYLYFIVSESSTQALAYLLSQGAVQLSPDRNIFRLRCKDKDQSAIPINHMRESLLGSKEVQCASLIHETSADTVAQALSDIPSIAWEMYKNVVWMEIRVSDFARAVQAIETNAQRPTCLMIPPSRALAVQRVWAEALNPGNNPA